MQIAQRVQSRFQITDANGGTIATLCMRLDGLPLAIELAAAQSAVYSPAALLKRLDNHIDVLSHGSCDAPPRLRSMRDAIGWSYNLLPEHLQQCFQRLSIFAGGFTASAAASVTSQFTNGGATFDDDLMALVDASLVAAHPETGRFTMLETVRSFGQEKLEHDDDTQALRNEHARWWLDLMSRARHHWCTPTQTHWGEVIEHDNANLRAALAWSYGTAATLTL